MNWNQETIRNNSEYGTESNPKIWVMREFLNSEANHLGMPLPEGRVRFYRRNDDGQIEFTGSGKFHPILPLIPRDEVERQRQLNQIVSDFVARAGSAGFTIEDLLEQLHERQDNDSVKKRR
jgi:hypothetical protein